MVINDKVYDVLKWIILIVSPALVTLVTTLGGLYGFETNLITGTIAAITTFAGVILKISSDNYYSKEPTEDTNGE